MNIKFNYKSGTAYADLILGLGISILIIMIVISYGTNRGYEVRYRDGDLTPSEWRDLMISKGLAAYNATNGNWQWRTNK